MGFDDKIKAELSRIEKGGAPKYHAKNAEAGKLFARERVRLLLDEGSFIEDGALANGAIRSCRPTAWSPASGASEAAPSR